MKPNPAIFSQKWQNDKSRHGGEHMLHYDNIPPACKVKEK